jgi:hypothetical protein
MHVHGMGYIQRASRYVNRNNSERGTGNYQDLETTSAQELFPKAAKVPSSETKKQRVPREPDPGIVVSGASSTCGFDLHTSNTHTALGRRMSLPSAGRLSQCFGRDEQGSASARDSQNPLHTIGHNYLGRQVRRDERVERMCLR